MIGRSEIKMEGKERCLNLKGEEGGKDDRRERSSEEWKVGY